MRSITIGSRTRFAFSVCLLTLFAWPAHAQSGVYVGGIAFADLQRSSGGTSSTGPIGSTGPTTLDGTVVGGGIRAGAFLASSWTLEVSLDRGATLDKTIGQQPTPLVLSTAPTLSTLTTLPVRALPSPSIVLPQFDEQASTKTTGTSVLLAYHPPSGNRLRAGFAGGLTFMHTATTLVETIRYTVVGDGTIPPPGVTIIPVPIPAPITTRIDTVSNQLAATVGAEVAVALSTHVAVVPEIRAHGFDGRFVIRPGVGVRWLW
jgi:hypothetical protein